MTIVRLPLRNLRNIYVTLCHTMSHYVTNGGYTSQSATAVVESASQDVGETSDLESGFPKLISSLYGFKILVFAKVTTGK